MFADDGSLLRRSCWYTTSPCSCPYTYGNSTWPAKEAPGWMLELGAALSTLCGNRFCDGAPDSINCNLYETPSSSLGWHSDNEQLFIRDDGTASIISISFGAARVFEYRRKHTREKPRFTTLADLDLLLMARKTQLFWEHRVPSVGNFNYSAVTQRRINLTFRYIVRHATRCKQGHS